MIKLKNTCNACPEQYDAFLDGELVGYLRLRHGYFRCENIAKDEIVYEAYPEGDGIFEDGEREEHLEKACAALLRSIRKQGWSYYVE